MKNYESRQLEVRKATSSLSRGFPGLPVCLSLPAFINRLRHERCAMCIASNTGNSKSPEDCQLELSESTGPPHHATPRASSRLRSSLNSPVFNSGSRDQKLVLQQVLQAILCCG